MVNIWTPTSFSFVFMFFCLSYLFLKCILQSIIALFWSSDRKIKTRQVCMQISSSSMAACSMYTADKSLDPLAKNHHGTIGFSLA